MLKALLSAFDPRTSPATRGWREQRYARWFSKPEAYPSFRGTYQSMQQAALAAPATLALGCESASYADHHVDRVNKVYLHDYPVMLWLSRLLPSANHIFDLGGNVGIHYLSYRKYVAYPPGIRWTVCDVPNVIAVGQRLAAELDAPGLEFGTAFELASGADVLLSSGTIQYLDWDLSERLAGLPAKPRHLFLNKLPLYDGKEYVTLQNARVAFLPYRAFNRTQFIGSLSQAGYELVDTWDVPGFTCGDPFRPEVHIPSFTGLYAALRGAT